jgi:hypothetical protein
MATDITNTIKKKYKEIVIEDMKLLLKAMHDVLEKKNSEEALHNCRRIAEIFVVDINTYFEKKERTELGHLYINPLEIS